MWVAFGTECHVDFLFGETKQLYAIQNTNLGVKT